MQSENENVRPANETNASTVTASPNPDAGEKLPSQEIATHTPSVDSFYEKLTKLYEFSGLSLLFNFRETRLDLYMFYKEVTERGGFYQMVSLLVLAVGSGRWFARNPSGSTPWFARNLSSLTGSRVLLILWRRLRDLLVLVFHPLVRD
ncbi:hypothetical protein U1Q18_035693 [Sarracenia purpurea var. burkii]